MATPYSRYIFGRIPWYGFLIVVGICIAIIISEKESRRIHLPDETIIDLALILLPSGIIGARLYYVFFSWENYRDNPIKILYIWEGGLAIYGGLLFGILSILIYCRIKRISILTILDILSPGVILAQAIGRWGNYFNQEAYGIQIFNSDFQFFPLAVLITQNGSAEWHMATFFYESILNSIVFIFLIWGRRNLFRQKGDLFYFYLYFYGSIRTFVEGLRTDSLILDQGIRISQLLSIIISLIILTFFTIKRYEFNKKSKFTILILWLFYSVLTFLILHFLNRIANLQQSVRQYLSIMLPYLLIQNAILPIIYGFSQKEDVFYAFH